MTYSTILDATMRTSWAPTPPRLGLYSGVWAGDHPLWETAGYILAALIVLGAIPALFIAVDHTVAVHWSNAILDLVNLR